MQAPARVWIGVGTHQDIWPVTKRLNHRAPSPRRGTRPNSRAAALIQARRAWSTSHMHTERRSPRTIQTPERAQPLTREKQMCESAFVEAISGWSIPLMGWWARGSTRQIQWYGRGIRNSSRPKQKDGRANQALPLAIVPNECVPVNVH